MSNDPKTAMEWFVYGVQLFHESDVFLGHGKDNAEDEVAELITGTLKINADDDESILHLPLSQQQINLLRQQFHKRTVDKIPTAYLTFNSYYCGLSFYVDERVIIPRSPLYEIILNNFEPFIKEGKIKRLLDMCCGSGCLGLTAQYYCQSIERIVLCDISKEALEVAEINTERLNFSQSTELIQSNLFEKLKSSEQNQFDVIVCNPPYVSFDEMENLPAEYRYEPALALDGRQSLEDNNLDGLTLVYELMAEAKYFLNDNGWFFLEVGHSAQSFKQKYSSIGMIEVSLESNAGGVFAIAKENLP